MWRCCTNNDLNSKDDMLEIIVSDCSTASIVDYVFKSSLD